MRMGTGTVAASPTQCQQEGNVSLPFLEAVEHMESPQLLSAAQIRAVPSQQLHCGFLKKDFQ